MGGKRDGEMIGATAAAAYGMVAECENTLTWRDYKLVLMRLERDNRLEAPSLLSISVLMNFLSWFFRPEARGYKTVPCLSSCYPPPLLSFRVPTYGDLRQPQSPPCPDRRCSGRRRTNIRFLPVFYTFSDRLRLFWQCPIFVIPKGLRRRKSQKSPTRLSFAR
jgi:hypothetical protein